MIRILAAAISIETLLAVFAPAAAQAQCSAATASYRTKAVSAAHSWQRRRRIWLEPTFVEETARQACDTASAVAANNTVKADRIGPAVGAGVDDYLTAYADLSLPARTVGASVRSSLGVQGFSRPIVRALGIVQFSYVHNPDRLVVGNERMGRVEALMRRPGPFSFAGYAGQRQVCAGGSTVVAGSIVQVRC